MDYIFTDFGVIPLESGQMQLNAVCRRDWISIHIGPTRLISTKKICGNPTEYMYPHNPKILHTHTPHPVFLLDAFLNKHIYAVYITMLLCVFSNDSEEQMLVKQIANCTVFGENQRATTTFITCLTRFRLTSHPFENLHRIPTGPGDSSLSPYPSHAHTHGNPQILIPTAALPTCI